jgi:hypothetical protein
MFQVEDLTSRLQHIRHATNIEQTLSLISAVWEMSLEFEIDYLDIQVMSCLSEKQLKNSFLEIIFVYSVCLIN